MRYRFIPTCVGNTHSRSTAALARTVHPHVRGEYQLLHATGHLRHGSSPRAWGIRPLSLADLYDQRFIPTCVGNTSASCWFCKAISVHPHVRGEYLQHLIHLPLESGSSPRAWGIRPRRAADARHARFIPTCVGNTVPMASRAPAGSVHPHVRGEYHDEPCGSAGYDGSSPRAWGIQAAFTGAFAPVRFIPTCVGNTSMGQCS